MMSETLNTLIFTEAPRERGGKGSWRLRPSQVSFSIMRVCLQKEPRALPPATSPSRLGPHWPLNGPSQTWPPRPPGRPPLPFHLLLLTGLCPAWNRPPCAVRGSLYPKRGVAFTIGYWEAPSRPLIWEVPSAPGAGPSLARPTPHRLPGQGREPRGLTTAGRSGPRVRTQPSPLPPRAPRGIASQARGHRAATRHRRYLRAFLGVV